MKKILFSSLIAISLSTVQAQRLDIFGGINPSGINHKIAGSRQQSGGTIGSHFGLSVFVPFNTKLYNDDNEGYGIFPALEYIKKGASKSYAINASAADIKLGYLQLNLPVYFTADMIGIGIGPYAAYALSGSKKFRAGGNGKEKIDFGSELKTTDYGICINMNLLIFKLQYDWGLANIATGAGNVAKTRSFGVSLDIPLVQ